MLKEGLAFTLAILLIVTLVACSKDGSSVSEQTTPSMSVVDNKAESEQDKDEQGKSEEQDKSQDRTHGAKDPRQHIKNTEGIKNAEGVKDRGNEEFKDVPTEAIPVAEFLQALQEVNLMKISELAGIPEGILNEVNITQWIADSEYDRVLDADKFTVSRQGVNANVVVQVGNFTKKFTTVLEGDKWILRDISGVSEADFTAPVDTVSANGVLLTEYMQPYGDEGGFKVEGLCLPHARIDWRIVTPYGTYPGKVVTDKNSGTTKLCMSMSLEQQARFIEDARSVCNGILQLNANSAVVDEYAEFVADDTTLQIVRQPGSPEVSVDLSCDEVAGGDSTLAISFIGPDTVSLQVKYAVGMEGKVYKSTAELIVKYVGGKPILVGLKGNDSANLFGWFNESV